MSGFGGFKKIGGGEPNIAGLPQAGEIKPAGDDPGVQKPAENAGPVVVDPKREQTDRIAAKLDMLLLKAAKSASSSENALRKVEALAGKQGLEAETRGKLESAANDAFTALQAIARYSGRDIAAALKKDDETGDFDWNLDNPVGVAVKNALDKQEALSKLLCDTINELPSGASHDLRETLEEAMLLTDRRLSEIYSLVCEFSAMANDPAVTARLDSGLGDLVSAQALKMHESTKIVEEFQTALKPLVERVDTLALQPERTIDVNEVTSLRNELSGIATRLRDVEREYAASGRPLDRALFESTRIVVSELEGRLRGFWADVKKDAMRTFVNDVFSLPDIPLLKEKFRPLLKVVLPGLADSIEAKRLLKTAAIDFVESSDGNEQELNEKREEMDKYAEELRKCSYSTRKEMQELKIGKYRCIVGKPPSLVTLASLASKDSPEVNKVVESLSEEERGQCTPELVEEFCQAVKSLAVDNFAAEVAALRSAFGASQGVKTQTARLVAMQKHSAGLDASSLITNKTLRAAFEGRFELTTLVATRMNNLPDADADPSLDSSNIVSAKPIGSGFMNTVYQVDFKGGSTYIFKPEAPGRQGLDIVQLGIGSYQKETMVAQLNMASQRTAETLGLEDVMSKTSVGSLNGQFGMFMEKVPGKEAADYCKPVAEGDKPKTDDSLSAAEIKALDDDKYEKVIGQIMRKMNRLEWFDLITGQVDRHNHNYMLNVDSHCNVVLKGIDNDAAFVTSKRGPGIFNLRGDQAKAFKNRLDEVGRLFGKGEKVGDDDEAKGRFYRDPGVVVRLDDGFDIDTSKVKELEVFHCLKQAAGCHSLRVPDYIDEELYEKLVALEKGTQARTDYLNSLSARLPRSQVYATEERLDAAIQLAKTLKNNGRMISSDDWMKRDIQRKVAGGPAPKIGDPVPGLNERQLNDAKKVKSNVRDMTVTPFRRDFIPFLAKDGWFDMGEG